jgi:CheY-like chemotaxis protein
MIKDIKNLSVFIIEDEAKNMEILERILLGYGITKIQTATNTTDAIELLEVEHPNLILLDLKIPYEKGALEDSVNALHIVLEVERINRIFDSNIRIIIISGTTQERGLQKLISLDKSLIQHMFDKGLMAEDSTKFKAELLNQINHVLNYTLKKEKATITLLELNQKIIFPLKTIDNYLFEFINANITSPFEKMDATTESNLSFAIIVKCGIVVEYLVDAFSLRITDSTKKKLTSLTDLAALKSQPRESDLSIRDRLIELTGRKFNSGIFVNTGTQIISRQAAEFAQTAYRIRNDASHTGESDSKNKNIFSDNNFTKEHALTSITLILPILIDYIKFKNNK